MVRMKRVEGSSLSFVPVNKLLLDNANPRIPKAQGQRDALKYLIRGQGSKLTKLADSIIENGYDASEPMLIMDAGDGNFVVKEGNRRLAVLKMLLNPSIIPKEFSGMRRRFQKDHDRVDLDKFRRVPTSISDKKNAIRIVERRHTGARGGAGVVSWGNIEGARFFEDTMGKRIPELDVLDDVVASGLLSEETLTAYYTNDFPLTNLGRLINDQALSRERLGISLEGGNISYVGDHEKILNALAGIVEDIATKKINVNDIYYVQDAQKYLDTKLGVGVSLTDAAVEPTVISRISAEVSQPPLSKQPEPEHVPAKPEAKKATYPRKKRRTGLIPPETSIPDFHGERRAEAIFDELKRLDLDGKKNQPGFKNCASIVMRSFLDMSADVYATKHGIPTTYLDSKGISRDRQLMEIVADVCKHLKARHAADPSMDVDDEALKCAIKLHSHSNPDNFILTSELNKYVHSRTHYPSIDGIRTMWDEMEKSILAMWRYL